MENLPMSIGVIVIVLAILYIMFRGSMDRYVEKIKYKVGGKLTRLKRWIFSGAQGY